MCLERFWGYSLIGGWEDVDPEGFAAVLGEAGLTVTEIELDTAINRGENINPAGGGNLIRSPEESGPAVKALGDACKAHHVILWITLANWNGVATVEQDDTYITNWCRY